MGLPSCREKIGTAKRGFCSQCWLNRMLPNHCILGRNFLRILSDSTGEPRLAHKPNIIFVGYFEVQVPFLVPPNQKNHGCQGRFFSASFFWSRKGHPFFERADQILCPESSSIRNRKKDISTKLLPKAIIRSNKNLNNCATLLFFSVSSFLENCIEWWIWWMTLRLFSLWQKRSSESSRTTKLQRSKGEASWTSSAF